MPGALRDGAISMPLHGRIKAKGLVLEEQWATNTHTYVHTHTRMQAGRKASVIYSTAEACNGRHRSAEARNSSTSPPPALKRPGA